MTLMKVDQFDKISLKWGKLIWFDENVLKWWNVVNMNNVHLLLGSGYGSKSIFESIHVVEQISFSMIL